MLGRDDCLTELVILSDFHRLLRVVSQKHRIFTQGLEECPRFGTSIKVYDFLMILQRCAISEAVPGSTPQAMTTLLDKPIRLFRALFMSVKIATPMCGQTSDSFLVGSNLIVVPFTCFAPSLTAFITPAFRPPLRTIQPSAASKLPSSFAFDTACPLFSPVPGNILSKP
jgi:hypothetical protein